jgi:hypothetical protein
LSVACCLLPVSPALADTDYFAKQRGTDVVMRTEGSRTAEQKWLIAGLAGGAAVSAIAGVWFHLEAIDARDKVSTDLPQSRTWNGRYEDLAVMRISTTRATTRRSSPASSMGSARRSSEARWSPFI